MEDNRYPRGSEWRRWDLHVHTKNTNKNDQFQSKDFGTFCKVLFEKAIENNVYVIGVTDYFSIDNYLAVVKYQKEIDKNVEFNEEEKKKIKDIFLLPNVELRMLPVTDKGRLVNIHCIFNPKYVEKLNNDFFNSLKHQSCGRDYSMTKESIVMLGKQSNSKASDEAAYKMGVEQFVVVHTDLKNLFFRNKELRDNTIVVVSNSNKDGNSAYQQHFDLFDNGTLDDIRSTIYKLSDCIFSSNEKDRQFFLGKRPDGSDENEEEQKKRIEKYLKQCGSFKPCIHGSDAHTEDKLFKPDNNRYCWIKADPTFEGLKQIINEPERVHIGENKPQLLERVETYPTKFIKNISIRKKDDSSIDEEWYGKNTSIDINPGLVAIVGNKGSGKSAITDIISLCANTHKSEFSFLKNEKFRSPKPYNRAKNFEAQLTWFDNSKTDYRLLDKNGDENQPERVKYIPQNFLENLCTTEDDKEFEKEMKSIIFQHIPKERRYEKNSLEEIIDYLSSEIKESEKEIKLQISEQNKVIIDLEDKKREDYKEKINNAKSLKEKELENLSKVKPIEVPKPNHENSEEEKKKQDAIDSLRVQLKTIESEINNTQNELTVLNKQIQDLTASKEKLERLSVLVNSTINEVKSIFDDAQIDVSEVVKFSVNIDVVQSKIDSLKSKQTEKMSYLTEEGDKSLKLKKTVIASQIQNAEKELSEPDRLYHKYVEDLNSWQEKVDAIKGNADTIGTIEYYESQIKYIDEQLNTDISMAYAKRKNLVLELLSKKRNELNIRSELYQPVSSFIESNSDLENYSMTLDATFIFNSIENFFDYINQRNTGTFCGKEQGMLRLKELQEAVSLTEDASVYDFAWSLNEALFHDVRNGNSSCDIKTQIKDSHNQLELYDFIYGLDYIEPLFQLRLDNKPMSALSPGERGALLLLFYLFIDMDDKPLIIDQPEENLDNESVYKYLVKFIKQAKENRQIIMVTHNPNLAVVCDADQIIKMNIDKKNKNKVTFMSGSIENRDMNKCLVDVLEGTYPAFHNRDSKYFDKNNI